jgi:transposase
MMPRFFSSREEFENALIAMHESGWGIRALCRHFDIGRNTVRRILRENAGRRDSGHDALISSKKVSRQSKLDPHMDLMKRLLNEFPDITGVRMHEKLLDAGFTGGSTIVTDRLRQLRPKAKAEPTVRFETDPGRQGQMDWSPYTIPFTQTGKASVLCFSYILGFSRRHYIDFTENRKFFTLIRRHQDAFAYFKGVPATCLYDGEKTVVLRWEAGQPVFNPAFVSFITHYRCRPIACKPGRAKTKGKVEKPFQYVENNLLNARKFTDLNDLRQTARWWLKEKSDLHRHETTGRPPLELFLEQEKEHLLPLPVHDYDSSEVALRVCRMDGFLEHDTNIYSVPYEYVADILTMKATENEIFIYSPHLELITTHERQPFGAGRKMENPEHRKSTRVRYGLEPVKEAFLQIGDAAEAFVSGLKESHRRNCGFHARFILQLKQRYHADDINRALGHAAKYHAFDGKAIERILKATATERSLESVRNEKARRVLEQALPEVRQRPLEDYSLLLKFNEEP